MIWIESRPTVDGKGKQVYYDAVAASARAEIANPIEASDIEIEIAYATIQKVSERKDADNVNKPTLDALKGIAYLDDRQVRSVTSTIFDKNLPLQISGRVEYMGRLFYSDRPHVLLISIYSDSRLNELGGENMVQQQRYAEWQHSFDQLISTARDRPHNNVMQRPFAAKGFWRGLIDWFCGKRR